MSRTRTGWIPTAKFDFDEYPEHIEVDDSEASLSWDTCQRVKARITTDGVPGSVNQEITNEVAAWQREWACHEESEPVPPIVWPENMGAPPARVDIEQLRQALMSFPSQLGLGWDKIHPRAIARLDDTILEAIVRLMERCEETGQWPQEGSLVIIVLLPKPTGGWRPIGLLAWLPKVWMKIRRTEAAKWEKENERAYMYAGPTKGADVAAWKQAARAEVAEACHGAAYAQVLLDLVKAFDRVPHHVLVREAAALGYSLWILRLSLATYASDRLIRVDGVVSGTFKAKRGITAGSGLATAEMRVVMTRIVDNASRIAPRVVPTLFVDDLSVEAAGGNKFVEDEIVRFTMMVCEAIEEDGMEISRTKSACTASCNKLGKNIVELLNKFGIKYRMRVISLGAALAAGTRRNASNLAGRMRQFRKRIVRFRKLRRAKVDTSRLMRTGAVKSITYGQAVTGVSNSTLLAQRRAVAAATAPSAGNRGQCTDMALILADGGAKGKADPAFDAHAMPIGQWAHAVWHKWLEPAALEKIATRANRTVRMLQPKK